MNVRIEQQARRSLYLSRLWTGSARPKKLETQSLGKCVIRTCDPDYLVRDNEGIVYDRPLSKGSDLSRHATPIRDGRAGHAALGPSARDVLRRDRLCRRLVRVP